MIFEENRYTKKYFELINFRKNNPASEEFFEKHHIIPKCLGGGNDEDNLVSLTLREHFLCHWLLTKMVQDSCSKRKMYFALSIMNAGRNLSSWQYEMSRKAASVAAKGKTITEKTRKRM